ncbi:uncharacterized protein LOC127122353 [Lathyrus oleraceus]|uniref:uncharacterized protein LOC127122353 n=1 Tax=Pisum sativum TaxID=3888 RepID=UPI0021D1EBF1|nr:uncharacterized protein LOC127122353 [Pisum sativum]
MESNKRNTYSFKFKEPDLSSLHDLVSQTHPVYRFNFGNNYGNLLELLNQKVDHITQVTLAQFYDPPLRCFTFQDFQLAPMLEEFERLVRTSMKNNSLFMGMDESLKHEVIAKALHTDKKQVTSNLGVKGNTKGFSLKVLLERPYTLLNVESWEACYTTTTLNIYGIILFLNMDGFIDMTAISIFLTENHVPALLVDAYYYLSYRHVKKKRMIACRAPLLSRWFLEHIPKTRAFVEQKDDS